MSDYTSVAPPQQTFNQSSAFAAAVQRAKQIAAKINPATTVGDRPKRVLEDVIEPDSKKLASGPMNSPPSPIHQAVPPIVNRPPQQSHMGMGNMPPTMGVPPSMAGGPGGAQFNEDIKVPDKMVGLIIGRGGEQITRLQAEAGCKIQMAPDSGGLPDRICSLSGSRDAINRAKDLIMSIVHQRGRTEGLGGVDMSNLPMPQNNYSGAGMNMNTAPVAPQQNSRNFVEIMVPGPKVGLIIGKGGETIKQLQEKSGAKMVVIQDGPSQEAEKPLRISGDANKVEHAKQLVYELIAEKEMQAYNRRGGGNSGGGGGRNQDDRQQQYNDYGGNNEIEVLVPRAAVGIVIGKGGDMIKKIQAETGARVQFQQHKDEGPGDRRCSVSGKPQQVEQARQRIEELIDSVCRRDDGGSGGGHRGRGRDRYNNRGGDRNGNQDYGGWENTRQQQSVPQEVTFTVPTSKCGVIIGRGGETIKQINQQSGAHCELDRRSQNQQDKTFTIRGEPDQIETAKRIISEKVQIALNFVTSGPTNNLPTAYPGMASQPYGTQNWGAPAFTQQWGQTQAAESNAPPVGSVQVNPTTGQPDYSLQWAEYYRSLGMHREAEVIEQQAKTKGVSSMSSVQAPQIVQNTTPTSNPAPAANGTQPDYSAQWAEYYRSLGKMKEAEAIESQMKAKQVVQGGVSQQAAPTAAIVPAGTTQTSGATGVYQQSYGSYPATGYYGGQNQTTSAPPSMPAQNQYGFSGYNYGGTAAAPEN